MTLVRPKYVAVAAETIPDYTNVLNRYAAEGYGLAFHAAYETHDQGNCFTAVLKLKDEQVKLEDAEDLINVDIGGQPGGELQKKLAEGWVIIAAFSKVVTIMKPRATQHA